MMINPFFPEHGSDMAHPLFGSIVCLLEFFLLLVEVFEVVVFCHNKLGGAIQLPSEVRYSSVQRVPIWTSFFAPLPS